MPGRIERRAGIVVTGEIFLVRFDNRAMFAGDKDDAEVNAFIRDGGIVATEGRTRYGLRAVDTAPVVFAQTDLCVQVNFQALPMNAGCPFASSNNSLTKSIS